MDWGDRDMAKSKFRQPPRILEELRAYRDYYITSKGVAPDGVLLTPAQYRDVVDYLGGQRRYLGMQLRCDGPEPAGLTPEPPQAYY
jgi:hypothetical protein